MTDPAPNLDATILAMETAVRRAGGFGHLHKTPSGRRTIIEICAREAESVAALRSRSVVEGWVTVPREPTAIMLIAADSNSDGHSKGLDINFLREAWSAMLSAAPAAPENTRVPAPPALGREEIMEAMQGAWNNIVADIGGYPDDITVSKGRKPELTFKAGVWAGHTADAILSAQRVPAGDGGGEQSGGADTPVLSEARSPEGSEPSAARSERENRLEEAGAEALGGLIVSAMLLRRLGQPKVATGLDEIMTQLGDALARPEDPDTPATPDADSGGIAATEPQEPYETNTLPSGGERS